MLFSSIVCWLWLISLVPIASILLLTCCGCKRKSKSPTEKKNKLVYQEQKNEFVNQKLINQQKNEFVNHKLIYHEKQIGRMCALHALNMLLQGRHFTFANLVTIAREIDQRERSLLTGSKQLPNGNYDATGYFSIQVITEALRRKANLNLVPLDSPNMLKICENPNLAQAFICHHNDHWFTLRKFGTTWFELNSLKEAPKVVPDLILEFWEIQYCRPGWCIYVVEGKLPSCAADRVPEYWQKRKQPKKPMKRTICSRIFGGKETGTERSDVEYLDETTQLRIDNNFRILDDELTAAKEKKMEPLSHNSEPETSHPTL